MLAEAGPADPDAGVLMNYEPSQEQALNLIIPKYVASLIYGALAEAVASENGARMQAMDSATGNAGRDCFRGVGLRLGDGDADILPLHLAAPFSPALFG